MRVALFASSFHPHIGGVEELVRQLAHAQINAGGNPSVVTMRWPKTLPERETFEGIPLRRYVFRLPERKARWLATYALESRRIQRAIDVDLRSDGSDLIHVQCVSGNAFYAYRSAKRLGLPLVVTLQGELTMDAARVYERSSVLPGLLRRLLRDADAVTACSSATLEEAAAFTGVDLGQRGHVVHNGVSVQEIDDAEPERHSRPYILAVGRQVPQKGFDILIEAYARIARRTSAAPKLVLAGDGPERSNLELLAERLGISESVAFLGWTDRTRTAGLFRGCQLFVLPSRHEPQGIVNLEAMAASKPVVATHVGGVAEIVRDGETGLLVPPDDVASLATAIERTMDAELADSLGRAGRARAVQFAWPEIAAQYEQVYQRAKGAR